MNTQTIHIRDAGGEHVEVQGELSECGMLALHESHYSDRSIPTYLRSSTHTLTHVETGCAIFWGTEVECRGIANALAGDLRLVDASRHDASKNTWIREVLRQELTAMGAVGALRRYGLVSARGVR